MPHGIPLYLYWRVNGIAINRLPSDIRDDLVITQVRDGDNEVFTLTITGKAEYNGTRVQCVVGGGGVERESENATLNIQGIIHDTVCICTVCIVLLCTFMLCLLVTLHT